MRTVNLGPLPVPVALLLLLMLMVALLVAAGIVRLVERRQQTGIGNVLTDMLIASRAGGAHRAGVTAGAGQ